MRRIEFFMSHPWKFLVCLQKCIYLLMPDIVLGAYNCSFWCSEILWFLNHRDLVVLNYLQINELPGCLEEAAELKVLLYTVGPHASLRRNPKIITDLEMALLTQSRLRSDYKISPRGHILSTQETFNFVRIRGWSWWFKFWTLCLESILW